MYYTLRKQVFRHWLRYPKQELLRVLLQCRHLQTVCQLPCGGPEWIRERQEYPKWLSPHENLLSSFSADIERLLRCNLLPHNWLLLLRFPDWMECASDKSLYPVRHVHNLYLSKCWCVLLSDAEYLSLWRMLQSTPVHRYRHLHIYNPDP